MTAPRDRAPRKGSAASRRLSKEREDVSPVLRDALLRQIGHDRTGSQARIGLPHETPSGENEPGEVGRAQDFGRPRVGRVEKHEIERAALPAKLIDGPVGRSFHHLEPDAEPAAVFFERRGVAVHRTGSRRASRSASIAIAPDPA